MLKSRPHRQINDRYRIECALQGDDTTVVPLCIFGRLIAIIAMRLAFVGAARIRVKPGVKCRTHAG